MFLSAWLLIIKLVSKTLIRSHKMDEKNNKILDADILFDNFDEFCEVQFKGKSGSMKTPSIVKNLSSVFNRVANRNNSSTGLTQSRPGTRSKSRQKSKSSKRGEASKIETKEPENVKHRLRLNLKNVFGNSKGSLPISSKFMSTRNMNKPPTGGQNVLQSFIQANAEGLRGGHLKVANKRKSQSPSKSKSKGTKNTKKKVIMLNNILNERDLFVRRILESKNKKNSILEKNGPVTGSTRLNTASRLESTKRTHNSIVESDNKLNKSKSISIVKPKSKSRLLSRIDRNKSLVSQQKSFGAIGITEETEDIHLKKITRQLFLKTTGQSDSGKAKKKNGSGSRIRNHMKDQTDPKNESRDKYFLPLRIGYKPSERAHKHSSFALSEEHSVGSFQKKLLSSMVLPMMNKLKKGGELHTSRGFAQPPKSTLNPQSSSKC